MQIPVCIRKSFFFFFFFWKRKNEGRKTERKECGERRLCNEFPAGPGWDFSTSSSIPPPFHLWSEHVIVPGTCVLLQDYDFTWTAVCLKIPFLWKLSFLFFISLPLRELFYFFPVCVKDPLLWSNGVLCLSLTMTLIILDWNNQF